MEIPRERSWDSQTGKNLGFPTDWNWGSESLKGSLMERWTDSLMEK
jgi:hypothetical protein